MERVASGSCSSTPPPTNDLEGLVTFDRRVGAGAAAPGIDVLAPGLMPDWWRSG